MGLAGLLTGSRRGHRRASGAGSFLLAVAAVLLPTGTLLAQPLLAEAAVGMALFLLLPGRLFGGKRVKRAEVEAASASTGTALKERLTKAAGALRDLYDSMGRNTPQSTEENPAIVFDRAAERVCRGCALCDLCWQREYTGTFNALNDATPYLLERGRAMPKDFPSYFADRCIHLPELITAINGELSAYLLRRQYRRQLEETRRSARGQYAQLSELLTATAAGLGAAVPVDGAPREICRVGAALRPKEGETVCGDTVVSFQTDQGTWFLLLADGMGSGEAARKESALTCRLLRQFLEAGIEPEAALKTLNSAMTLRGAETGSFTTIDLCAFDPATGEAAFYKYGAAPSYLKKGGTVRRVTGASLPAGLRGAPAPPDVTRVRLEPGGFVVMVSDGVADSTRDEWLQDLLAGWQGEDPQNLAGSILSESIRREHLQDDCGIQVLYRPVPDEKQV
jgi:stage II sporulation protein E